MYPTHVSFGGDILNSGLAFMLLLMIMTSILFAQLRILGKYSALSMHLSGSFFFHHLSVTIFFLTALFWDTIHALCEIISLPPEAYSRKLRRTKFKGKHKLFHFPRRWVILSAIMVNGSGGVHPGSLPLSSIVHTYERMTLIHELVTCTPSTLFQFCSIRVDESFSCTFQEYIDTTSLSALVAEESWYHDEISPCATLSGLGGEDDYSPDYFFDSYESISSFDEFFDCLSQLPTSLFSDWMTLDELSNDVYLD